MSVLLDKKRYDELIEVEKKLIALEEAGVDNWIGWDDAMDLLEEMNKSNSKEKEIK